MRFRVIIIFLLIVAFTTTSFGQRYNFRQFSVEDGLSQSQVFDIAQDAYGNMWFSTFGGGITVYDGTSIKYFSTDDGLKSNNVPSLFYSSDSIMWIGTNNGPLYYAHDHFVDIDPDGRINAPVESIVEDFNKTIWIGTDVGLWKYENDSLEEIIIPEIENPFIVKLFVDFDGKLWISTASYGILIFDGELFVRDVFPSLKFIVTDIFQDNKNIFWFATYSGVYFYDNHKLQKFENTLKNPDESFTAVLKDKDGNLWLGTERNGIIIVRKNETLYLNRNQGLGFIGIYKLFNDRSNNVWVGTDGGGASIFNGFLFSHFDFSDISNNFIMKILIDNNNNKWLGTDGDGVIFLNESRRFLFTDKDGIAGNSINDIAIDKSGNIWFATYSGLSRYNGINFKNYHLENGLVSDSIISLLVDNDGNMWCGSIGYGISKFNGKHFENYVSDSNYLEDYITHMYQAKDGKIYFATEAGLRVYDGKSFKIYNTTNSGLFSNSVWSVTEDHKGNIWTSGEGISVFDGKSFKTIDHADLTSNVVYFLHFDRTGNMLAGTEKGLDRISFDENFNILSVKHFGKSDGFIGIECNENAVAEDKQGHVWIGTIKGLTIYKPDEISTDTIPPIVNLSNIKLFYEEIDWSKYSSGLTESFKLPIDLKLPYNKNTLTFTFSAVNYNIPEKVRYRYILVGLDDTWHPETKNNEATYTNLPHGEYTFKVNACNHDGIWTDEPISFPFTITSPYYLKWWFILLAALVIAMLIYGYVFLNTLRLKRLHTMLTQKVTERTRLLNQQKNELVAALKLNKEQNEKLELAYEKVKESSRLKEIFLANTSHEIRTPLNVIIGFTNLLLKSKLDRKQLNYLNNIRVSGNNLLVVLNDILDFSKIEANKLVLEKTDFSIEEVIKNCYTASAVKAKEKKLEFTYKISPDIPDFVNGDPVRLSQIITNLLRNAIKFTNELGKVTIAADVLDQKNETVYLLFRISDTGIGISKEHQQKIFESFTQAKNDMTRKYGGTGLGLSIVKQLIDMHNGEISLYSEKGKGSTFSFTIGYKNSDIKKVISDKLIEKEMLAKAKFACKILLVEDNVLNVNLAVDTITSFNNNISIDVAENGKIGVEMADSNDYDLIIMDIQMPVMDGYEATAYIRNQLAEPKCNIPILGMTAHAMKEEKDKCFELGMNDYLTKPFVPEELFSKITNLVSKLDAIPVTKHSETALITEKTKYRLIDLDVLSKTYKGNKQKIAKIVELCISNIPKQITELQQHFKDDNWKNLRVIAHSLKTSLNYLGLKELRDDSLTIEKSAADEKDLDKVPDLVANITSGWDAALEELKTVLADLKK